MHPVDVQWFEFHKDLGDILMGELIRVGVRVDLVEAEAFDGEDHFLESEHWDVLRVVVRECLPEGVDLVSVSGDIAHFLKDLTEFHVVQFFLI